MTYRIEGLQPHKFARFFAMNEEELRAALARKVIAGEEGRYPCRVSLRDADPGEELILTHYINHAVDTPYRNGFAVYVRRNAEKAVHYIDEVPPVLRDRPIALRCYAEDGTLYRAGLSLWDDVDPMVRQLLLDEAVAYIDAHNAMHGCFAARIERNDGASDD